MFSAEKSANSRFLQYLSKTIEVLRPLVLCLIVGRGAGIVDLPIFGWGPVRGLSFGQTGEDPGAHVRSISVGEKPSYALDVRGVIPLGNPALDPQDTHRPSLCGGPGNFPGHFPCESCPCIAQRTVELRFLLPLEPDLLWDGPEYQCRRE
jgi:hypothetical protein